MKWHKTIHCPLCGQLGSIRKGGARRTKGGLVQVFYCVHCDHRLSASRLINLENWEEIQVAQSYGNKRTWDQAWAWYVKTGRIVPRLQVQDLARAPAAVEVA